MIILPASMIGKWEVIVGSDGAIHVMPIAEDHATHYGCICDPKQKQYAAGGCVYTHRMLAC